MTVQKTRVGNDDPASRVSIEAVTGLTASTVQSALEQIAPIATDPNLVSWAAITRASGFDTFTATPSSANLRSLLTDETGTGAAVFATAPTISAPTLTGTAAIATAVVSEAVTFSGVISPSQITSNQNDYAPTGFATAAVLRLTSDASRNITGLAGGAAGRTVYLHNVGAQSIVLKDESASSTAANRFALSADVTLTADTSTALQYDGTSSRWRVIGGSGGGGSGDALTANPLSQFAATTSAQLAGVISDETGSGALMFGTSPTITTDITIPNAGLLLFDTDSSHKLTVAPGSNLTANRTLTVTTGDSDRTLTISGNATVSQDYSTTGSPRFWTVYLKGTTNTEISEISAGIAGVNGGLIPAEQLFRLNANLAGSNATGNQSIFGKSVSVNASTVYGFELVFTLAKTAGTTSHTVATNFGGTATLNNFMSTAVLIGNVATGSGGNGQFYTSTAASALGTTAATIIAAVHARYLILGTVSINAGGTLIPQYALSAAPGGAYSTVAGSYMRIWPIGASGADTNIGTWA